MPQHPAPEASTSPFPSGTLSFPMPTLSDAVWDTLGDTVMNWVEVTQGLRSQYDRSLDVYNAMYEMRVQPRNVPWPNAANVVIPMVATGTDELVSRTVGAVYQPRLYTMRGNDPLAAQYAHVCEQFYNGEFERNDWFAPAETCIQLAARDGLAIGEVLWDVSTHEEYRYTDVPDDADPTGARMKKDWKKITFVDYDAPRRRAVEARDFLMVPNHAQDENAAQAVAVRIQMDEQDIDAMVAEGIFKKESAEFCLSYAQMGRGELSTETDRPTTYTISGKIAIADPSIAAPEGIRMARGPLVVWRYHTRQFDLNGDGKLEENIIWVHALSRKMLGFSPWQYWGKRPFFPLSLMPRPNRIYGFGVPERGRGLQEEANAVENGKLDWMDMSIQPMRRVTKKARFRDEDRRWGVDAEVEVESPDDVGFIPMPPIPQEAFAEIGHLQMYFDKVIGAPQAAAQTQASGGSQQRSAKAAQLQAAVMGLQSATIIRRVRAWELRQFKYIHSLYQQYAPDQLETIDAARGNHKLVIPKEILGLNYTPGIAGMGGPLDKDQRRMDMVMLAQFLMGTPLVQGNIPRIWQLCRMVAETFDVPEITALIGTMDEAIQQAKSMAEAQQQQERKEMLLAIMSHGNMGKAHQVGQPKPGAGGNNPATPPPGASFGQNHRG